MEHFRRSLKYLWPYRARLTGAILCVLFIAALWGGGLGLLLPAAKILISEEGLHGWAYTVAAEKRLNVKIVMRTAPPSSRADEQVPTLVLDLVSVDRNGRAESAGIKSNRWVIGMVLDAATQPGLRSGIMEGDVLVRQIANTDPSTPLKLIVCDTSGHNQRAVILPASMEKPSLGNRLGNLGSDILLKIARIVPEPRPPYGRFFMFLGVLVFGLLLTYVRCFFTYLQEYLVGTAIWRGIMDLRCENYNVVLHLPTTYFSEKGVSDTMSRFVQDTNELARGQNTLLGKTMVEPAKLVGTLCVALWFEWRLTLLTLVAGPPAYFLIRKLGKKMHKASKRALENWSLILAVLSETLIGIRVVKAYTMEGAERKRFFQVNRQLLRQQNRMERLDSATAPAVEALGLTAGLAAAAGAGYLVFVGISVHGQRFTMEPLVFLTWLGTLFALFDPVRKLAKVATKFQQSDAAAKRVFDMRDLPQEPTVLRAPSLAPHSQSIEFCDVHYRYPNTTADTLKGISVSIRAGMKVAIVGPNGSGKTTMISLLPRLLDPTSGVIRIDGQDIMKVSIRSLRRQIGLVTQDTVIFHATIAENIAYGLRRPRQQDVLAAAKKAFVDEFVNEMPNGFDTIVGEYGATLSGGQKQRISIARAILRNPRILIFDEAMSQVDANSERRITEAMEQFVQGRTTLMIAHRFATVLSADMILVVDEGRILDSGTHEELLNRCQLYRHLYQTQFADTGGK